MNASVGCKKQDSIPVEINVATVFIAINPDLPTTKNIILPYN